MWCASDVVWKQHKMYRTFWCLLLLLVARASSAAKEMSEFEALGAKPTNCRYETAFDMYGAHCADLRLSRIPSLKRSIEILDFSKNKLRDIEASTLSGYSSIRFLYLAENRIRHIDEDAFTSLTSLQTLDLSENSLSVVPNSILQLPQLSKLYLSGNLLTNYHLQAIELTKPIKAPLELLDISECEIKVLPDFGALPELMVYNISKNPLEAAKPEVFAQACKLNKVDMRGSIGNIKTCDINPLITWFDEKQVYFILDTEEYDKINSELVQCPKEEISPYLNKTHGKCKSLYLQVQRLRGSQRSMMTIIGGLAGFLVGFILFLYLTHRCNVAKAKFDEKKAAPAPDGDKNATAVLLSNVSYVGAD